MCLAIMAWAVCWKKVLMRNPLNVLGGNLGDFGEFCKGLGLCGLLEEGAHEKSPKCLGGNLGDFGEFCKGLTQIANKKRCFFDIS